MSALKSAQCPNRPARTFWSPADRPHLITCNARDYRVILDVLSFKLPCG